MQHSRDSLDKLASLIDDIDIAMLATSEPDGELRSRPMATQKLSDDGSLWFFTRNDAPKVSEAEGHPVNLAYADAGKNRYVSVSGHGHLVTDAAKIRELWKPALKAWFPQGLDDPSVALLRVDIERAEYWDAPASAFVQIAGFVKATATGQAYHPGEHEKLTVS